MSKRIKGNHPKSQYPNQPDPLVRLTPYGQYVRLHGPKVIKDKKKNLSGLMNNNPYKSKIQKKSLRFNKPYISVFLPKSLYFIFFKLGAKNFHRHEYLIFGQ